MRERADRRSRSLHEGRLHLRIDPRDDGSPWLADTDSLARALAEASERLAAY